LILFPDAAQVKLIYIKFHTDFLLYFTQVILTRQLSC